MKTQGGEMKSTVIIISNMLLFCSALLSAGCGYHYGFGIRSDSNAVKFRQDIDDACCFNEYEFKTVLYRSDTNALEIVLQHPIYALAEPDVLISQVGVKAAGDDVGDFKFTKVEITHTDETGFLIVPLEHVRIPADKEMWFYIVKYNRKSFPKDKVREHVSIEFSIGGKIHTIYFAEDVFWVKRTSKASAMMSI